jgi:hypothetical protein
MNNLDRPTHRFRPQGGGNANKTIWPPPINNRRRQGTKAEKVSLLSVRHPAVTHKTTRSLERWLWRQETHSTASSSQTTGRTDRPHITSLHRDGHTFTFRVRMLLSWWRCVTRVSSCPPGSRRRGTGRASTRGPAWGCWRGGRTAPPTGPGSALRSVSGLSGAGALSGYSRKKNVIY